MSLKYVFKQDESELRRDPLATGETVTEGEFVVRNSSGELARFDAASDTIPDGIIVHHEGRLSDALVAHDEDYVSYGNLYTFDAADGDNPYYLPLKSGQTIMPETVKDTNLTEPVISDGTTVAITTDGSSGETRLVESGHATTNTVDIGEVYLEPQHKLLENNYDQRIPVYLSPRTFPA
jgi:hypothetical protein